MSGCYWENEVKFYDCPAISLTGFDVKENYLKNVTFRNVKIIGRKDGTEHLFELNYLQSVTFENISII